MLELASARVPRRGLRPVRRAPAAVPGRHVRARLHEPLLRPPRGGRASPLPRRGAPRRARARRRRLGAPRRRRRRRAAGADPQRRLALAGLQALLRARRAGRRAGRRRDALRRTLVRGRTIRPVTKVAPFLRVADAEASVEWYARLGFSVDWRTHAEPHLPLFVAIENGDALIFLSEHTGDAHPDGLLYIYVDDVDAVAADFGTDRGARVLRHARDRADRSRRQPAPDRHARRRVTVRRERLPVDPLAPARQRAAAAPASRRASRSSRGPSARPCHGQRAYLFGQAPGIVEGEERLPWRGRAGQTLRRWLAARRRRALRALLLRLGDALLPGPAGVRARRPHADAARAGSLRVLARLGARAAPARSDRDRRRARAEAAARARRR